MASRALAPKTRSGREPSAMECICRNDGHRKRCDLPPTATTHATRLQHALQATDTTPRIRDPRIRYPLLPQRERRPPMRSAPWRHSAASGANGRTGAPIWRGLRPSSAKRGRHRRFYFLKLFSEIKNSIARTHFNRFEHVAGGPRNAENSRKTTRRFETASRRTCTLARLLQNHNNAQLICNSRCAT
jgi:hypothetical protein